MLKSTYKVEKFEKVYTQNQYMASSGAVIQLKIFKFSLLQCSVNRSIMNDVFSESDTITNTFTNM